MADEPGARRARSFAVDRTSIDDAFVEGGDSSARSIEEDERRELTPRAVVVELFDGEQLLFEPIEATASRVPVGDGKGGATVGPPTINWVGQHRDEKGAVLASAGFTLMPDGSGGYEVAGSVSGTERYVVEPLGGSEHRMVEHDPSFEPGPLDPPEGPPVAPATEGPTRTGSVDQADSPGAPAQEEERAALVSGSVIRVLVAYVNTIPNASSRIQTAISQTNQAISNTAGLPHRVELARLEPVAYPQAAAMGTDLSQLQDNNGDDSLDFLHALRETVEADLVALIVPNSTDACGVGYIPQPSGSSAFGFSVSADACFTSFVLTHELGHNVGGDHNPEDAQGACDPFAYSCGHWVNGAARTVMSYDRCGGNCPTALQFSSPVVDFIGHPGVRSGVSGQRDNGASLNNMAVTLAAYRPGPSNWQLRNSNSGGPPSLTFPFGIMRYQHLACNVDADPALEPVVYDNGTWYARLSLTPGPPEISFAFGYAGPIAVCGDWNGDGIDGIGIYTGGNWDLRDTFSAGPPQYAFAFGYSGPQPIVGDWDGLGGDGIGIYVSGSWNLRQTPSPGSPQVAFSFGYSGTTAVAGNWDGLGSDGIGIYASGNWNMRHTATPGNPEIAFAHGFSGAKPVAGDWDGNASDTAGIVAP